MGLFTHFKKVCGILGLFVGKHSHEIQVADADGHLYHGGTELTPSAGDFNKVTGLAAGLPIPGSRFAVSYPQIAAADMGKTFFIAPAACKIILAYERHVTVAGQAGTMQVEKLTSGEAPGAGDALLAQAFDLTSTANTPVTKNGVTTAAGSLAAGDALCLKLASGAATSYAAGSLTVLMQWI
jgi:hypothetical protein